MFSRAHLLIQKQLNDLENDPKILISRLNNDNIFELIALIEGQKNTLFENGVFQVYMKFTGINYRLCKIII
jgi:ubiquitin-protein ligase